MSDIKLFRFSEAGATELKGKSAKLEQNLHQLIERHMECFLGIHFLAGEFPTGKNHHGRIDSLGLDENHCPVILEYKRHNNQNVINQGLFYLDWLLDHHGDFKLLVQERLGTQAAKNIEWDGTRVLCIAGDFTRYDLHAVAQIGRNIELIRYKFFADDLLLLEQLTPASSAIVPQPAGTSAKSMQISEQKGSAHKVHGTLATHIAAMPPEMAALWQHLLDVIRNLGDDVSVKSLLHYVACSRFKNFACLAPLKGRIVLWLKLDPAAQPPIKGFSRDVTSVGHLGTGNLEISIRDEASLAQAIPLIEQAYAEN